MSAYKNVHQVGQEICRHCREGHVGPPELVCKVMIIIAISLHYLLTQIKSLLRALDDSPFVLPVGIRIQIESHWQCEGDADEAGCNENHTVNFLLGRILLIPYACHLAFF